MHIEIEKKDLLSILSTAQNIVEKKQTMPILINVLIETGDNLIKAYATDLQISLVGECHALVKASGKIAVNAKNLYEIIRELSDGKISLLKKENNWVEIKQNRYTSKIIGVAADEFPVFPSHKGLNFLDIEPALFKEMIERVAFSISNDDTRVYLNGIYFEQLTVNGELKFRMVATDGHRLSVIDKPAPNHLALADGAKGVIIPKKSIYEIKKVLEETTTPIQIAIEGNQFVIKLNTITLIIRLIEGKYPNYHQLMPTEAKINIIVDKESLLGSVRRVSLLASQKSRGIHFIISQGKVEVSSSNPEIGDAKEEIEIDYEGEEYKIGFNSKYLFDILNNISDPKVSIVVTFQNPVIFRPASNQCYTCVLSPMRM